MKKIIAALSLLILVPAAIKSQSLRTSAIKTDSLRHAVYYRVALTDKRYSPYSLQHPELYLSARALLRRQQQHLSIDSTDLPLSPHYMALLKQHDIDVIGGSRWNNTLLVRLRADQSPKLLKAFPFVRYAMKVKTSTDSIASPPIFPCTNNLGIVPANHTNTYGVTEVQLRTLGAPRLHELGYKGDGVWIAVIDGGFMNVDRIPAFHPINLIGSHNFVNSASNNIYREADHGTKVLGLMAVCLPHQYVGTAPHASYLLLRSEDTHSEYLIEEDYWAEAVEYADSMGVDIINSSLGYHAFDDTTMDHLPEQQDGRSTLVSKTASLAAQKGIILVNSNGNEGNQPWRKPNFPADATNILAVGAMGVNGNRAAFSSIGPTADGRIKPDVSAPGYQVAVISGRGSVVYNNGTSFAAPLIAGLTACLRQAGPHVPAKELINMIRQNASQSTCPNNELGYGVPNFEHLLELVKQQERQLSVNNKIPAP